MSSYEEAEVMNNGSVIIRYYFGKTVVIPGEVMKSEAIPMSRINENKKVIDFKQKIVVRQRRFKDGDF